MKLRFLHDSGKEEVFEVRDENISIPGLKDAGGYIPQASKFASAVTILKAFYSNSRPVLFDDNNETIKEELRELGVDAFPSGEKGYAGNGFPGDFRMLFFTSGTTGKPVGAFKTDTNIHAELTALGKLLEGRKFKKAVVTVPFIHFYGALVGLMLPVSLQIDLLIKEHFLPHELAELVENDTLVITTPLYIKALLRTGEQKHFKNTLFISSTAPLDTESAKAFIDSYETELIQIFGSTETGGIAYKRQDETLWTPLPGVHTDLNEEKLLRVDSPFVSEHLFDNGKVVQTDGTIQTFDYVEKEDNRFRLVGRNSQIFKIAGKRYSTIQIENILEEIESIQKALVVIQPAKDALKGERLQIFLESEREYTVTEIKKILQKRLSNIKFSIELKHVERIPTTAMGKKLRIG